MTATPTSEQERGEAKVVSRYLPSGYSAEPDVVSDDHDNAAASAPDLMQSGQGSALKLLGGGDLGKIHHLFLIRALAHLGLPLRTRMVKWLRPNGELLVAFAGSIS
jgi:hypothetical protein